MMRPEQLNPAGVAADTGHPPHGTSLNQRAIQACLQRDADALWTITESYLHTHHAHTRAPSPHTLRLYRRSINLLLEQWDGETVLHPSHEEAARFTESLKAAGMSPSTVKVYLAGARALYRALHWAGAVTELPFGQIRAELPPREERTTRQKYSEAERAALLQSAGPVDGVLILLISELGLLISEAVSLTWQDVDLTGGHLSLRSTSGHGDRLIKLPDTIEQALRQLPGSHEGRVLSFGTDARARQRLQQLCHRAGVPYRGVHALSPGAAGRRAVEEAARRDMLGIDPIRPRDPALQFEVESRPQTPDHESLIGELRRGIRDGEMRLYYLPKLAVRARRVEGVEALLRWEHPSEGLVLPARFRPTAEHPGLSQALNLWVLEAALRQWQAWQSAGLELPLSINLVPESAVDARFPDVLDAYLKTWQMNPFSLMLEVNESAVMAHPYRAMKVLTRLHEMGVGISLDNVGTGYSSLAYVARMPLDEIKIDRSFVLDVVENAEHARIVQSIISLGHSLNLEVVAEGVESQETLDLLASMGCDLVQGYHVTEPLPGSAMTGWVNHEQVPFRPS